MNYFIYFTSKHLLSGPSGNQLVLLVLFSVVKLAIFGHFWNDFNNSVLTDARFRWLPRRQIWNFGQCQVVNNIPRGGGGLLQSVSSKSAGHIVALISLRMAPLLLTALSKKAFKFCAPVVWQREPIKKSHIPFNYWTKACPVRAFCYPPACTRSNSLQLKGVLVMKTWLNFGIVL